MVGEVGGAEPRFGPARAAPAHSLIHHSGRFEDENEDEPSGPVLLLFGFLAVFGGIGNVDFGFLSGGPAWWV